MQTQNDPHGQELRLRPRELDLELRRSQALVWSILDTAGEAFITCDGRGRIELFNAAAELMFGVGPQQAIGKPLHDLLTDPEGNDLELEDLARAERRQVRACGLRGPAEPGGEQEQFQAEVCITALEVHDRTMGILVVQDITERLAEQARHNQVQHLESIGQLAAGIAHEINTPTQFVGDNVRFLRDSVTELLEGLQSSSKAIAELAGDESLGAERHTQLTELVDELEDLDLDFLVDEVPQAIAQSMDGIERVGQIVQAMRNFSHPGSMGKAPTDLNACIQNTCTVSRSAWKYQAEMDLELDEALPKVECSESELNQVFLNLVVNGAQAIEATREEGDPLGKLMVRTRTVEAGVEITITDSGCGMPPEVQKRIFEPFYTTKGVGKGTGQGLALAHNVVSAHGGTIDVSSEPGEGTVFTLTLPLTQAEPQE